MLNRAFVAVFAAALWATPAAAQVPAQIWDGNELYKYCSAQKEKSPSYVHAQASCVGYVVGLIDWEYAVAVSQRAKPAFCVKDGMTVQQVVDIVINYLKAHPELRHHNGAWIAGEALRQAVPCR